MDKNSVVKNRLELNRKTSGYSQREVAQILGFSSVAQISRWERGEKDPNLKHALQLSALYKRLVNDLFWDLYQEQRGRVAKEKIKIENEVRAIKP